MLYLYWAFLLKYLTVSETIVFNTLASWCPWKTALSGMMWEGRRQVENPQVSKSALQIQVLLKYYLMFPSLHLLPSWIEKSHKSVPTPPLDGKENNRKVDFLVALPLKGFWVAPSHTICITELHTLPRLLLKFKHIEMRIKKGWGKKVTLHHYKRVRGASALCIVCFPSAFGLKADRTLIKK